MCLFNDVVQFSEKEEWRRLTVPIAYFTFFYLSSLSNLNTYSTQSQYTIFYLRDVRHPPAQHVHGDLVAVLVLPVGGLVPGALHRGPAVRHHARHHAPDTVRQLKQNITLLSPSMYVNKTIEISQSQTQKLLKRFTLPDTYW